MAATSSSESLARSAEYLTTEDLAARIKYDPRTMRDRLKDSVPLEGIHSIRLFAGRTILYVRETIERDMVTHSRENGPMVPMANGRVCQLN